MRGASLSRSTGDQELQVRLCPGAHAHMGARRTALCRQLLSRIQTMCRVQCVPTLAISILDAWDSRESGINAGIQEQGHAPI